MLRDPLPEASLAGGPWGGSMDTVMVPVRDLDLQIWRKTPDLE